MIMCYLYKNPLQFTSNLDICPSTSKSASASHRNYDSVENAESIFKDIVNKSENNVIVLYRNVSKIQFNLFFIFFLKTITIESNILLAKLYYAQMRYDEAFKQLTCSILQQILSNHLNKLKQNQQKNSGNSSDLINLIPKLETVRQYQIFSEAYSLKGLCLERKKLNQSKQEELDTIDSFEMASLLAVHHSILIHNILNPQSNLNSNVSTAGI